MKNIANFSLILLVYTLFSCNKNIDATPINADSSDFNFVTYLENGEVYLYVRPFGNFDKNTPLTFQFNTNQQANFIVKNDTLLSGDKIKINYNQFVNYRLIGQYQSKVPGEHTLDFKVNIGSQNKTSQLKLKF